MTSVWSYPVSLTKYLPTYYLTASRKEEPVSSKDGGWEDRRWAPLSLDPGLAVYVN